MKKENDTSWSFPWGWLSVISFISALFFSYTIFNSHHTPAWLYDGFVYSVVALVVFLLGWWATSGIDKMDDEILNSDHSMRKYY